MKCHRPERHCHEPDILTGEGRHLPAVGTIGRCDLGEADAQRVLAIFRMRLTLFLFVPRTTLVATILVAAYTAWAVDPAIHILTVLARGLSGFLLVRCENNFCCGIDMPDSPGRASS
jgi:hypothetical protein